MGSRRRSARRHVIAMAAAAACSFAIVPDAPAGQTGSAVTISLSGSTAMRSFTVQNTDAFSLVTPGTQMNIGGTVYPAATSFWTSGGPSDLYKFQLAPTSYGSPVTTGTQRSADALRIEWHEQGSVEGILEMVNDQIAPVASVTAANRNPTTGNPTWVNRNSFTAINTAPSHGWALNEMYAAPGATSGTPTFNLAGLNTSGGQNAVQMAISDVNARQGFAITGTAAYNRKPGEAGYGKGNQLLSLGSNNSGIGSANVRHALEDQSALNMVATATNPRTGTAFGTGAWNTAGIDNTDNKTVAITATLFAANPGTGLDRLNRKDAQFLQTSGRLANGADFNVATRDVNSGTLNVASLNVGVDPSWVVGENDGGNGTSGQTTIGANMRFTNKTSGGSQLRPTIQNSRMALGHLSIADSFAAAKNGTSRPIRALDYRDDDNDLDDGSNGAHGYADPAAGAFVQASATTITDGSYVLYQNQTYVTLKKPDAAFAADTAAQWAARTTATTGIQGDTSNNDVRTVRDNIISSTVGYPFPSLANAASPAEGLLLTGYVLPKLMAVKKSQDGINQSVANPDYDPTLRDAFIDPANGLTTAFTVAAPNTVTSGSGSSYGNISSGSSGYIQITASNYLFGNFKQNGIRDFAAIKAAQAAQAALAASGHGVDMFAGAAPNTTKVTGLAAPLSAMSGSNGAPGGATKGDLVVMGDFNSDGKFDGKDLYAMARGAALADNTSTDTITLGSGETFGQALRRAVLVKNAALDWMNTNATSQQKLDARANATNDPAGANAFNKFDVNRDGLVNRVDARLVDQFVGKDYRILEDQLAAVITEGSATRTISLVDVELNDTGNINRAGDFDLLKVALGTQLRAGDADFDGAVTLADFDIWLANIGPNPLARFGQADFDGDAAVTLADFDLWLGNIGSYGASPAFAAEMRATATAAYNSAVPEPSIFGLLALGSLALGRRTRRVRD